MWQIAPKENAGREGGRRENMATGDYSGSTLTTESQKENVCMSLHRIILYLCLQ